MSSENLPEIVQPKKSWTIKLLLLVFAVVLVFNFLESRNLIILSIPSAQTAGDAISASPPMPGIIPNKELSFLTNKSSNVTEFVSLSSIDEIEISNSTYVDNHQRKKRKKTSNGKNKAVEVLSTSDMDHLLEKNRESAMVCMIDYSLRNYDYICKLVNSRYLFG